LFVGGSVFRDGAPRLEQVAVVDGVVAAIGPELSRFRGPNTDVVDLGGGLLHRGFTDAHVHPIQGGLERLRCDLSGLNSASEYLTAIGEYATSRPDAEWILGGGWQLSAFPGGTPNAADLDAVVPDRPVFLPNRDHHGAWVNSRALELAGISASTPDPADGRIERTADGTPSGTLHEGAAALVQRVIPPTSFAENYDALMVAQSYLHSLGITGWQDAIVGDYFGASDTASVYALAAAKGELMTRVVGALWWDRDRGLEQINELLEKRARFANQWFRLSSVKIMLDGIVENQTAAMLEPYVGSTNTGISFLTPTALTEAVTALDAEGFQVHIHAIGDRAVRDALDAFEAAARANGPSANHHHIAHLQVVHPVDVPRFAALGITANLQSLWATNEAQMTELTVPILGQERSAWQYPFGDLERSGGRLASGSDWPVSTPDPWQAIHVAVNRSEVGESTEPFYPEQSLGLATALTAYTSGSAWLNAAADLDVGATADLAVTDRNPFELPIDQIGRTKTSSTWVAGTKVFEAQR
jgi:predicted amidohydrolase YtcJ